MSQLVHRLEGYARAIITGGLALSIAACGGGGGGGGSTAPGGANTPPNRAPSAAADVLRADGLALNSINVLANDSDPDGDTLTVTIEQAPVIGSATVNSNGSVRLDNLPADFKGITHFAYRVADGKGLSTTAGVVIFVGTDPFRVVFAANSSGNDSPEVYLADFTAAARVLTDASQGNMRLRGFVASDNGATIVYRRQDTTAPATVDLSFVRTANADEQVRIAFPAGIAPLQNSQGADQFAVSPDGKWIAAVAGDSASRAIYVVNVATPGTVVKAMPANLAYAAAPRFALNSQALYFLASDVGGGARMSLYTVALSDPTTPAQISAPNATGTADGVADYAVGSDQSHILLQATRGGRLGVFYVDPAHLQTEIQINHSLAFGEAVIASTVGLPTNRGGSARAERVAYTTQSLLTFRTYVAEASSSPNPREIAPVGSIVVGFRPDGAALLYSRNGEIYEASIDTTATDKPVGDGGNGIYDSTGNIVLLEQSLPSGGSPPRYPALAVAVRETFGTTQTLGSSGMAAHFINLTGADRGIAIIGEGATTGSTPANVRLSLVNALARQTLIYLSEQQSPTGPISDGTRVVGY